jgi:sugar lactone lactonase YvrE
MIRPALAVVLAATAPHLFFWPSSVAVQRDGSLLVLENGLQQAVRIDPATGATRVVATGFTKAVTARRAPDGALLVNDENVLRRIAPSGVRSVLVRARDQVGPFAVAPDGRIAYTVDASAYLRSPGGTIRRIATGLAEPHGVAFARDGSVLVSDTGHDRVLRIRGGRVTTFARVGQPRGLAVARTVYVVGATAKRIFRFSAAGKPLGAIGPRFHDPYDVAVAAGGTLYVVETAEQGWLVQVDPNGRARTVPTR